MSRYTGKYYRGASKEVKRQKQAEAQARQERGTSQYRLLQAIFTAQWKEAK